MAFSSLVFSILTFFFLGIFQSRLNVTLVSYFLQIGRGSRGDVTILPTLVINNRQYRGLREFGSVVFANFH